MARHKNTKGTGCLIKRGSNYYGRITIEGKTIEKSLHTSTEREAKKRLAEMLEPLALKSKEQALQSIQRALDDTALAIAAQNIVSKNLFQSWVEFEQTPKRKPCDDRTLSDYASKWDRFSKWMTRRRGEDVKLEDVTERDAQSFMAEIKATQAAGTYNKYLSLLKRVWDTIGKESGATVNPWHGIATRHNKPHRRRPLSLDELREVLAYADSLGHDVGLLFAIGVFTGLRRGDCITLDWRAVDMSRRVIVWTPHKTARHGTIVKIPILNELYSRLDAIPRRERQGRILKGVPETDCRGLCRLIAKVFDGCGIARNGKVRGLKLSAVDVGFHSLRHTFVSLAGNAGVPLAIVQAIVGHTDKEMTALYFHADEGATAQAFNAFPSLTLTPEGETIEAEYTTIDGAESCGEDTPADNWEAFTAAASRLDPRDLSSHAFKFTLYS